MYFGTQDHIFGRKDVNLITVERKQVYAARETSNTQIPASFIGSKKGISQPTWLLCGLRDELKS